MVNEAQLFIADVMHSRIFPKKNSFGYGIYYLALPLPAPPLNGFLNSFDPADVGPRDGSDPLPWVQTILSDHGIAAQINHITLFTMPRVCGYVFNPVSFYFCFAHDKSLKAVLCEVHNTFGEQHSYLCMNEQSAPIMPDQWLVAEKLFHVSPFLERSGHYKFRFDLNQNKVGVFIDYYDETGSRQLATSLTGTLEPLTAQTLRRAFWSHPLVTLKAIGLIHWQALKLILKGIRHISKPEQKTPTITTTHTLNTL